jgi:hypothetical protein
MAVPLNVKWLEEEERYLFCLHVSCRELTTAYMSMHKKNQRVQTMYRLPAIVLSSLSGVASFGTSTFPEDGRVWVGIVVGAVNILISILNTIEAYLHFGEKVAKSLSASNAFKKISDDITCELSIPIEDRETNGIIYLRECFTRYQQTLESAPPLESDEVVNIIKHDISSVISKSKKSIYMLPSEPGTPIPAEVVALGPVPIRRTKDGDSHDSHYSNYSHDEEDKDAGADIKTTRISITS